MKCNFINIRLKNKEDICLNNKREKLFKLSVGNRITNLKYNKNKNESSNQNLKIIYDKKYQKKNIGKMKYGNFKGDEEIKIFNKSFISNNIKRVKIIINNKKYKIEEKIQNEKQIFDIKIKFLDNIIYLNSMFKDCKPLYSVFNFQNFNTKYLKEIFGLFEGCSSLKYNR